jgi:tRNA(Leu) C34 or U34 (ribose-2'-O)-methylase TrmL
MSRGYSAIGLVNTKKEVNLGGAMRAAYCYGASMIAVQGKRYKRESADTSASYKHIPLIETDNLYDVIPYDCIPIAVEITPDSKNIRNFVHPERAFYIFGPEDGSIPKTILDFCKYKVSIPTKICMNLAATVNVVLYDRLCKS